MNTTVSPTETYNMVKVSGGKAKIYELKI
jgi:hypothetical protein